MAVLSGTVTDGTGAIIREANVRLLPANGRGASFQQSTDRIGAFTFSVPPGRYALSVSAPGFATYTARSPALKRTDRQSMAIRMTVASLHEEISVLADAGAGGPDPDDLAASTVFEGDGLNLLSADGTTLRQELQALAGAFGTPNFVVNGFSGGRLPPKSSIRSIRVNRNLFSAAFGDYGQGRVEVDTKPGTDRLHGSVNVSGTDQAFDAPNPYSALYPPFYDFVQDANLNGPLGKKTSFFVSELTESLANNAVVNAADPQAPTVLLSSAVAAPQQTETFSLRIDRQITPTNIAYVRDEWNQVHIRNSGIVPLVLPDAAFAANTLTNTLQLADMQILGARAINEARFQYLRTRLRQDPNSTAPSILVEGILQNGGNPAQVLRDNQDAFEVQDRFELERGKHVFRTGFGFRSLRDANTATAGFNGQYIFPDVASYLARQPMQYSQTVGQPGVVLLTNDLGLYAEDDWKLTANLTLSYGLRFEHQSAIPDGSDPAPRLALAWAVRPGKRKTPLVTLRAGYGIFYNRFPTPQLLQSVRQNGSRQVASVAQNPDFNPDGPPVRTAVADGQPTTYEVSPGLRSAYMQVASFSVSHAFGKLGTVYGSLLYDHDTHLYLARNSNAPLPGTFTATNPDAGVRPLGSTANIYQFASTANGNLERFSLNYHLQISARFLAFGSFIADKNYDESDGADRFTANPYNVRHDYARSSLALAHHYAGGLQWLLPYGFQLTPFLDVHSGIPFDITTGTDLNGDTIFNDRPALATDRTRSSAVTTGYGSFDVLPAAGQAPVPRNYGTSPGFVWLQIQFGKDFRVGPRPSGVAASQASPGGAPDRPWGLHLGVEVHNVTNHNNPGLPVGALAASPCTAAGCNCNAALSSCPLAPSPYFGHSLSLADSFSPNTASNRTILLQTSFSW